MHTQFCKITFVYFRNPPHYLSVKANLQQVCLLSQSSSFSLGESKSAAKIRAMRKYYIVLNESFAINILAIRKLGIPNTGFANTLHGRLLLLHFTATWMQDLQDLQALPVCGIRSCVWVGVLRGMWTTRENLTSRVSSLDSKDIDWKELIRMLEFT